MKCLKNKTATILIAIVLTISIGASTILIQPASSHTPAWQIATFAYITASPNPVGVGQTVLIYMWLDKTYGPGEAALTNTYRFHNYNLTIVKPDGKTETQIFDYISDTTSNQYIKYTPDQVGTYTLLFNFPGQNYTQYAGGYNPTSQFVNDSYLPSSASSTINVTQDTIPNPIGSYPFPSEYWTRPIYGENTDWWSISSNWLGLGTTGYSAIGSYQGQTNNREDDVGPQTAHVMWTKPLQSGGVVGGDYFPIKGNTYFEGSAYAQRFVNPIIVNGKLYYTEPIGFQSSASLNGAAYGPTDCIDLRTGQLIWSSTDVPPLSFALIYDVEDPQQHGVAQAILCTNNFARAFDADTGKPLFNVTGVPTGTAVLGPQGEHLRYVFFNNGTTANPDYYLCEWNSTKLWSGLGFAPGTTGWVPAISGTVVANQGIRYDMLNSVTQNQSITWRNTMSSSPTVVYGAYNDVLICRNGSLPTYNTQTPYTYFAVNINASRGTIGNVLWWQTYTPPAGNITVVSGGVDPKNRVFIESYRETVQWVGYSMTTGQKLWGPTGDQVALDYYGNPHNHVAYGKLYSSGMAGLLYCYDTATGNLLWTYGNGGAGNSTNGGFYGAFGNYATYITAVGNGIVYLVTTEHTVQTPIYKGSLARAVNATDGSEIWTLSAYTGEFTTNSYAMADGFATFFNGYDNQIYSVGRGPSALTVEAPKTALDLGRSLVISGTVTDISAGTKQDQQAANFPNSVPCSSDASMNDWMGHVYQQKPLPTNFKGVDVTIDVIDSNSNYRNIGTATTDASGTFNYQWKPDIEGKYTVIATFHGTNGYWPSYSETSFAVDPAEPTPAPTEALQSNLTTTADLMMYLAIGVVAIIIAIAIVGLLILRKHP